MQGDVESKTFHHGKRIPPAISKLRESVSSTRGVINVTRAALPILRKQRSGHFVQISSTGGRTGVAGLGPYQTAKWAVEGFSEVLSREVAPLGIKVTLIEPGGFRTDWGGSSMSYTKPSEDYRSTVQFILDYHNQAGNEPGDPAKAAQAIIPPTLCQLNRAFEVVISAGGAWRASGRDQ
jgi:NAD(P)-dependent dehydrogenase (short-subunit alcohol dehydrogenase family)